MSTPEAVARVRSAFPELSDRPIVAIPNGYDSRDFAGPAPTRDDGIFRIVHSGYLHTQLGLDQRRTARYQRFVGGQLRGVDLLPRSHYFLVQAVQRLLAQQPELTERLEVVFAGVLSDLDAAIARRLPVARLPGYLRHAESVELLRTADLLFLPMQKLPPGMRATIVPGKTYEYLASGRPILAAVPPGDARDLVTAAGTGYVCEPDDVDEMAAVIRRRMTEPLMGQTDANVAVQFEYRTLAGRVSSLLDEVVAQQSR